MILLYPPTAFGKIDFLNKTYGIAVPIIWCLFQIFMSNRSNAQ